ncbi:L,D-transpeptidase family protein (plasmid) [Paracoccus marcusii]|nr:L,D-transpeptidase family protein [Paracoccus marcusii]
MHLLNGQTVLRSYDFGLGNQPVGPKQFEGDGKTPEGLYFIDRFNPRSRYHLSVGISYPNEQDKAYAAQFGRSAGSDIMFHGRGPEGTPSHHATAIGQLGALPSRIRKSKTSTPCCSRVYR